MDQATDVEVRKASWEMPALCLIPVVLITSFTNLGTGWLIAAWAVWGLSLLLGAAQWSLTVKNGVDGWVAWTGIVIFHLLLPFEGWVLISP